MDIIFFSEIVYFIYLIQQFLDEVVFIGDGVWQFLFRRVKVEVFFFGLVNLFIFDEISKMKIKVFFNCQYLKGFIKSYFFLLLFSIVSFGCQKFLGSMYNKRKIDYWNYEILYLFIYFQI